MRFNEANIFLFIATIIIGILIAMNINLGEQTKFLDVEQYQEAYDDRIELQTEISNLEDEYYELNKKINKYEKASETDYEIRKEMSDELKENKLALGLAPVVGDGVKITLNDAPGTYSNSSMLIHDWDLARVINDLRTAGAEAIAINGYRIIGSTSSLCAGPTIEMGGIKIIAPFYITAIGNQDVIKNFLENQENHVKALKARNCFVEIESVYNEKLPAYNGELKSEYLKQEEK
ncbi:MAG TPA: division initiation protein [Clostridium sp.]|nr:division initiation protein [Clostridium sp.]